MMFAESISEIGPMIQGHRQGQVSDLISRKLAQAL